MMMYKHQNSTLEIIIAVLFIGTVLALSVVVIIIQEANAESHITTDKLPDKALRSLTWPNHIRYSYDPEQEKIMYEPWTLISR
jgi:hypothetical protein